MRDDMIFQVRLRNLLHVFIENKTRRMKGDNTNYK
jgi:hypothetical protein